MLWGFEMRAAAAKTQSLVKSNKIQFYKCGTTTTTKQTKGSLSVDGPFFSVCKVVLISGKCDFCVLKSWYLSSFQINFITITHQNQMLLTDNEIVWISHVRKYQNTIDLQYRFALLPCHIIISVLNTRSSLRQLGGGLEHVLTWKWTNTAITSTIHFCNFCFLSMAPHLCILLWQCCPNLQSS